MLDYWLLNLSVRAAGADIRKWAEVWLLLTAYLFLSGCGREGFDIPMARLMPPTANRRLMFVWHLRPLLALNALLGKWQDIATQSSLFGGT